jgi:hypothetical protein
MKNVRVISLRQNKPSVCFSFSINVDAFVINLDSD